MSEYTVSAIIGEDRRLTLQLPPEVEPGEVEVRITAARRPFDREAYRTLLAEIEAHQFVPPPGAPDVVEMIREDRQR